MLKISNFLCLAENKAAFGFLYLTVAHFTVTGENKAGVDLVLIQNVLLYYLNHFLMLTRIFKRNCHKKRKEVCTKTRSTSASRSLKVKDTKPTTVKWSIRVFKLKSILPL